MSRVHFPREIDGELMSFPALIRLSGLSRWDILKALEADPTIVTLAALRAAVVARKSRPTRVRHRPSRTSRVWNGSALLNKPRTR